MTRWYWSGALLLVTALAIGLAAQRGALVGFDVPVMKALVMTRAQSAAWAIRLAQVTTHLGDPSIRSVMVILVLALLVHRRAWRAALTYLVTVALAIAAYSAMKEAFARARPHLAPWLDHADTYSYPSGHAAGSMVVLLLAALLLGGRPATAAALLLSGAIGLSRIALGMHWPSDVVGGWTFGMGAALIGYAMTCAGAGVTLEIVEFRSD